MTGANVTTTRLTSDIRQVVDDIVRNVTERDDLEPGVDLFDQGVTSLAFIRIVALINETYEIDMDVAELDEAHVDSLSALVEAQVAGE
jgi:acyl carrier protein